MFYLTFFFLVLRLSFLFCNLIGPRCFLRQSDLDIMGQDKHTDCLFYIYTKHGHSKNEYFTRNPDKKLTANNIHLILSLYFALENVNKDPHILPNISLLVKVECNLLDEWRMNSLSSRIGEFLPNYYCINQRRYLIVLTGPIWLSSAMLGPLLYITNRPEIYYGPFHPLLSSREQFPHLYQTAPKDTSLALAMVYLVIHFRWNWVGAIISDDDLGLQFLSELRKEMQRNSVCLAFVHIIMEDKILFQKNVNIYYNEITTSSAKVVIIYGDKDSHLQLNLKLYRLVNVQRIWVTTSQWNLITYNERLLLNSFYGTFTFLFHFSELPGFTTFIKQTDPSKYKNLLNLSALWWVYFNCSPNSFNSMNLNNCSSEKRYHWLFKHHLELSVGGTGYALYNTVHAVAHALHEMLLQEVDTWPKYSGENLEFDSWQMVRLLKNIQFINAVGDQVNMNQKENLDMQYDIHYTMEFLSSHELKVKIGRFTKHLLHGEQLYISEEMIKWNIDLRQISPSICSVPCSPGFRKSPQQGKAVCCFDCTPCPENEISNMTDMDRCVKCPDDQYANNGRNHCLKKVTTFLSYEDPLGMSLACLALCFSVLTLIVLAVFLKHRDTPTVKANNRALSCVLLISLIFCFLCSLLYIGQPNMIICLMQQTIFAVVFTVAASTVLAKTITVVLAFKVTTPGRRMRRVLVSGAPNFIIPICTMIQLILCGIWLGTSPPFVDVDINVEKDHILIICNKGSIIIFYCVLGYLGFIAMGSFTVAFLARNLPDTFNEAKYLTFSMLVFCSVWITFLPVYHSTKGKAMVAVEVFCILASSAGLFFCIFVPKCFIILLRPKRNYFQNFRNTNFKIKNDL
ncbi:vomeronasal type-2 receptor 116-like isoform X2 [Cricetulus griseus]|uniref:Vomeronasal type-2 receptor 116-like isoform X2 n=1 Tax=Cricetulus griseus TaxID=10029 RepID=A0A9J7JJW3_CRIGR|nr:vomeronasal type-2 receptor 116-like isoform X2 [Cricetulus griseus]